mmetsp:Transcript_80454/g.218085  ORF Transcript_80454/g.218085 Transcript_80454/m.218085 type:complete len:273 (+) Transcript_80454:125-943(+)
MLLCSNSIRPDQTVPSLSFSNCSCDCAAHEPHSAQDTSHEVCITAYVQPHGSSILPCVVGERSERHRVQLPQGRGRARQRRGQGFTEEVAGLPILLPTLSQATGGLLLAVVKMVVSVLHLRRSQHPNHCRRNGCFPGLPRGFFAAAVVRVGVKLGPPLRRRPRRSKRPEALGAVEGADLARHAADVLRTPVDELHVSHVLDNVDGDPQGTIRTIHVPPVRALGLGEPHVERLQAGHSLLGDPAVHKGVLIHHHDLAAIREQVAAPVALYQFA